MRCQSNQLFYGVILNSFHERYNFRVRVLGIGIILETAQLIWKRPEFQEFAGAKHPQTPEIRQLSLHV